MRAIRVDSLGNLKTMDARNNYSINLRTDFVGPRTAKLPDDRGRLFGCNFNGQGTRAFVPHINYFGNIRTLYARKVRQKFQDNFIGTNLYRNSFVLKGHNKMHPFFFLILYTCGESYRSRNCCSNVKNFNCGTRQPIFLIKAKLLHITQIFPKKKKNLIFF